MSELYMMVTITNRKYMSKFAALYRENQIEVGTVSLGMGTASSSILDYMGLEDDEKSICFGEVGFSGEVRAVNMAEQRVSRQKNLALRSVFYRKSAENP